MFQSRNREAFGFKSRAIQGDCIGIIYTRFNLVIERLLVSSWNDFASKEALLEFQSRNREAFGFKCPTVRL